MIKIITNLTMAQKPQNVPKIPKMTQNGQVQCKYRYKN